MTVELSGKGDTYATVTLPLTPYEMLDTLDKLRMTPQDEPEWEICGFLAHRELHDWIGSGSVYELNALCQKLSELNPQESTVFEGLVEMEKDKGLKIIPMHRLLDLAYSTGQCHLLDEVHNEEQLGRFAAENGFVPEADDLSDKAFELLDFKKIGERFMRGEGGVIVRGGYVAQDGDLAQDVWKTLDLTPPKPDYAVLVELIAPDPNDTATLALPAPPAELDAAMALTGAHELSEAPCLCLDCRAPALRDAITDANSLADACRAADQLAALSESQLKIFRALITAMEVTELDAALDFAERIDEYLLSPEMRTFEETAEYDLRFCLGDEAAEVLLPHVNLYQYGRALQEREQFALTDYGRVQRVDCQPLMAENQKEQPTMGGMEMTQG